jgi:hypothetical protein
LVVGRVLPTLATGALAGVGQAAGSAAVNKAIGNGIIYVKRNGIGAKVMQDGSGLRLSPWAKGSSVGEGLYMKAPSGGYVEGSGILLGENSPFRNIPILGMLL